MKEDNSNTDKIGQIGQIGYLLLTISAIGHIGHNKSVSPILYYLYIFSYILITSKKFNLNLGPFKKLNGNLLIAALYLLNLKYVFLSKNMFLTVALIIMYVSLGMDEHLKKYKKFIFLFASIIYGYLVFYILISKEKSSFDIIKGFGCLILLIYYFIYFIKENTPQKKNILTNPKKSNTKKKNKIDI